MLESRLIILTPYSGPKKLLMQTIDSIIGQLNKNDIWVIILDNQNINEYADLKKKYQQITLLNYVGPKGAGNTRNMGLDYLINNIDGEFLFFPFDGDDKLIDTGISLIKKTMKNSPFNIITFAHQKIWPDGSQRTMAYSGVFGLKDLLKQYITPCGSTVLKINDSKIFKHLRFGSRFRANDALFFFRAVKHFSQFKCCPDILLRYHIGNINSLSGKKYKMIYYKFMVFKDFGLSNLYSIFLTLHYVVRGVRRYFFKHSV